MTNVEMLKVVLGLVSKEATVDVKDETINVYEWFEGYIEGLEASAVKRNEKASERRAEKWFEENNELVETIKNTVKAGASYSYKELTELVNEKNDLDLKTQKVMAIVRKIGAKTLGINIVSGASKSTKKSDEDKNNEIDNIKAVIKEGSTYTYEELIDALAKNGVDYSRSKVSVVLRNMEKNKVATITRAIIKGKDKSRITTITFSDLK